MWQAYKPTSKCTQAASAAAHNTQVVLQSHLHTWPTSLMHISLCSLGQVTTYTPAAACRLPPAAVYRLHQGSSGRFLASQPANSVHTHPFLRAHFCMSCLHCPAPGHSTHRLPALRYHTLRQSWPPGHRTSSDIFCVRIAALCYLRMPTPGGRPSGHRSLRDRKLCYGAGSACGTTVIRMRAATATLLMRAPASMADATTAVALLT